jgi:hypothetical protein
MVAAVQQRQQLATTPLGSNSRVPTLLVAPASRRCSCGTARAAGQASYTDCWASCCRRRRYREAGTAHWRCVFFLPPQHSNRPGFGPPLHLLRHPPHNSGRYKVGGGWGGRRLTLPGRVWWWRLAGWLAQGGALQLGGSDLGDAGVAEVLALLLRAAQGASGGGGGGGGGGGDGGGISAGGGSSAAVPLTTGSVLEAGAPPIRRLQLRGCRVGARGMRALVRSPARLLWMSAASGPAPVPLVPAAALAPASLAAHAAQ